MIIISIFMELKNNKKVCLKTAHLCLIKNENTEYVDVPFYEGASLAASQPTMTVFDKVITENLQF